MSKFGKVPCNLHGGYQFSSTSPLTALGGGSLLLDGTSSYFDCTADFSIPEFSLEFWVYMLSSGGNPRICAISHGNGFEVMVNGGTTFTSGGVYVNSLTGNLSPSINFPSNLIGNWTYFLVSFNQNQLMVYINGQSSAISPQSGTIGPVQKSPYNMTFGYNPVYGSDWTHGYISEVAFYTHYIPGFRALQRYSLASSPDPNAYAESVLQDNPRFYWRLNDLVGSTSAKDYANYTLPPVR